MFLKSITKKQEKVTSVNSKNLRRKKPPLFQKICLFLAVLILVDPIAGQTTCFPKNTCRSWSTRQLTTTEGLPTHWSPRRHSNLFFKAVGWIYLAARPRTSFVLIWAQTGFNDDAIIPLQKWTPSQPWQFHLTQLVSPCTEPLTITMFGRNIRLSSWFEPMMAGT